MKVEFLLIKEENAYCNSIEALNSILVSNSEIKIDGDILKHKKFEVKYSVQTGLIESKEGQERFFHVSFEKKIADEKVNEALAAQYGEFCKLFRSIIKLVNYGFRINTLWDDISFYYSKESYPLVNEIENLMRKLIFKFMCMKVGMNWLDAATPKEVKDGILKRSEKRDVKDLFENCLYEADFIHLAVFLFKEYSTVSANELVRKISEAKKASDLDLKSLKEVVPKSNWDRYFSKIIKFEGLNKKWEELYDFRNKIAHNKQLNKSDYDRIVHLTEEIRSKLIEAIKKIDEVEVPENKRKEVSSFAMEDFFGTKNNYTGGAFYVATPQQGSFGMPVNLIGNQGVTSFNSNKNCVTCGKMYASNPLSTIVTSQCDDCRTRGGAGYVLYASPKICTSCKIPYFTKPGEMAFSTLCEKCLKGGEGFVLKP